MRRHLATLKAKEDRQINDGRRKLNMTGHSLVTRSKMTFAFQNLIYRARLKGLSC